MACRGVRTTAGVNPHEAGPFSRQTAECPPALRLLAPGRMVVHTQPVVITLVVVFLTSLPAIEPGAAAAPVVGIRALGKYFIEPANLSVTVDVEPDPSNRMLRIEADSEGVYRATEIALDGEHAIRVHVVRFRGLPAGRYRLRAEVRSARSLRGAAEAEVLIVGKEAVR